MCVMAVGEGKYWNRQNTLMCVGTYTIVHYKRQCCIIISKFFESVNGMKVTNGLYMWNEVILKQRVHRCFNRAACLQHAMAVKASCPSPAPCLYHQCPVCKPLDARITSRGSGARGRSWCVHRWWNGMSRAWSQSESRVWEVAGCCSDELSFVSMQIDDLPTSTSFPV